MIKGLHHVGLNTQDMNRLVEFYTRVFDFEVAGGFAWRDNALIDDLIGATGARSGSSAEMTMLRGHNCYLEILQYNAPEPELVGPLTAWDRGITHLCFCVDDLAKTHRDLTDAGVDFVHTQITDLGEIQAIYGRDPDGNLIELVSTNSDEHRFAFARLAGLPESAKR